MISCECGDTFDLYKELKRHCMAKEFEFACKYCKKVFVSHDNRMRHHRQEHIHLPRPTSTYGVSRRLTRNGHSLLSEIRHLNTRDRGDDEEITFRMTAPQRAPSPKPSSPSLETDDDFLDWLNNVSGVSTPLALVDNSNSDFINITPPPPPQRAPSPQQQENPHKLLVQRAKVNSDTDIDIAFYIFT